MDNKRTNWEQEINEAKSRLDSMDTNNAYLDAFGIQYPNDASAIHLEGEFITEDANDNARKILERAKKR